MPTDYNISNVRLTSLGPLLFLIYINDIIDCFDDKVNCKLYADDVKIYTELRSAADTYFFQDCLDRIYQWSLTWQLQISSQKCCVIDLGKSTAADDCETVGIPPLMSRKTL